jgi:hypothetical protein
MAIFTSLVDGFFFLFSGGFFFSKMPANKRKYFAPKDDALHVGIPHDSKGFLCTCSGFEKDAVREIYRLLDEFSSSNEPRDPSLTEDSDGEEDLDAELEALRAEKTASTDGRKKQKRFQQYKIKARGVIFVRFSEPDKDDPVEIFLKMADAFESGGKSCRAVSKVLPVVNTCKAHAENALKLVSEMISKTFPAVEGPKTYSIDVSTV